MNSIRHLEHQQCRTCYDSINNLQLLTSYVESSSDQAETKTYVQLLLEICNINVMDDQSLGEFPQFICLSCSNKLKLAHDFIEHTRKINQFLKSLADVLKTKSRSDFIEKPALDIPSDVKFEKDDDVEFISNEREFLYSPVGTETYKLQSTILPNDKLDNTPCSIFTSIQNYTNNKINENGNEHIKEIITPNTIDFINNDVVIKNELDISIENNPIIENNLSSENINDTDNTKWITNTTPSSPCNKSINSSLNLERLTRSAHNSKETRISCSKCSKIFSRTEHLNSHMERMHKVKSLQAKTANKNSMPKAKSKPKKNVPSFSCNECKKIFTTYVKLDRHKKTVHAPEEEKIACVVCGHKFARTDNYKRHMKFVHSIDLPRKPMERKKEVVLPRTTLVRKKLSPYSCKKCDRKYVRRSELYKHEVTVHKR